MKKGFTLIELLAVIAILAIIMIIATPRIMDAIENSRISAYKQDEQMMIKATQTYFGNNAAELPENIGDTVEVTLSDLKTNEFIGEVSDQVGSCDGYILVTKTEEGYSYNPQLKCGDSNTISSSADDGLVVHYTFDEFAESTTNLYSNGDYDSVPHINSLSSQTTYENENIEKPATILSDNLMKSAGTPTTNPYAGADVTILPNTEYTVSLWVWVSPDWEGDRVELSLSRTTGSLLGTDQYDLTKKGTWQHLTRTGFTDADDTYLRCLLELRSPDGGYVLSDGLQVEKKDHATPFTASTRTDFIQDNSLNNYNGIFSDITPEWVRENGNGYYHFEEATSYINVPYGQGLNAQDGHTFSMWLKKEPLNVHPIFFAIANGANQRIYIGELSGKWDIGIQDSLWNATYSNTPVTTEWTHIVLKMDTNEAKLYINGEFSMSKTFTPYTLPTNFNIGNHGPGAENSYYQQYGYMDEIRIYNRVLSDQEIKYQYDTQKSIYK